MSGYTLGVGMRLRRWIRVALSLAGVALITLVYSRVVSVNPTTVAMSYLVLILLIASRWEMAEATVASLVATVAFNVFFLPPVGQLTIADPQNWVSFLAFTATAIVASQLSGRARQRTVEAVARQSDLERLYALSRSLLLSEERTAFSAEIAQRIAETFGAAGAAVFDRRADTIAWGGRVEARNLEGTLREVGRQATTILDASGAVVTAIRLGGAPIGSLAIIGVALSDTVLQSISNLAAIALERARGQEATARAEAARQSSELRTAVLDAVAHEFKTPLTSMTAAASDLRSRLPAADPAHELAVILNEELERLQAIVSDAIRKLRIDSGDFALHRERVTLSALVEATLRDFQQSLDGHSLVNRVPASVVVEADRELLQLALKQLLDNALKYSPPTSRIEIEATANGAVTITVRNSGPAIAEPEQARLFERFYRGTQARHTTGTGMGLAIVQQIVQAHGGSIAVSSTPESGTAFTLTLLRSAMP